METERVWALESHLVTVSIYPTSSQGHFWPSFCSRDGTLPIGDSHRVLERQKLSKLWLTWIVEPQSLLWIWKGNKLSIFSNCWRTGRGSLFLTTKKRCLTWTMSNFSTRLSGTFSNTLKLWKLTLGGNHSPGGFDRGWYQNPEDTLRLGASGRDQAAIFYSLMSVTCYYWL